MLTTDPGDSNECYACKVLEVWIIHCHHSLIQVGGAGSLVGGVEIQMGGVMSQWVGGVTGGWGRIPHIYNCEIHQNWWIMVEF